MLVSVLKKINSRISYQSPLPMNHMVPVYHAVCNEQQPHLQHIIRCKNSYDFEQDLDMMLKTYEFVDWPTFKHKQQHGSAKPYALLTFDDGLIEFKDQVMPILLRKGMYAINFINPAFVDGTALMFRCKASLLLEALYATTGLLNPQIKLILGIDALKKSDIASAIHHIKYAQQGLLDKLAPCFGLDFEAYLAQHKVYMNLEDLQQAKAQGFGIASHSWDHPLFAALGLEAQLQNAQKSIDYIREHDFLSDSFAFPFLDAGVSMAFFEQLFATNPELKFSFGTSGFKWDSFGQNLQRVPMENGRSAQENLRFEAHYYRLKQYVNKNTIHRP